ncbi:GNAT family N-acetyltransferase [Pseudothauera rhizosphaerae]|uniref:GNAT family N-acetyltransferase n=1 Tax=Pseudothauera rhizosphaerae TaxID=2565932 RepID=A0A4V3WB59_9RHOO|nr:GNAT family N-acetyltransferase [Pseudothauera rhizosphaerae]THF62006.1 GNAT family N-acetyltransferase [Pseudothauera rhizosphaerae]
MAERSPSASTLAPTVVATDLRDPAHAAALVALLDHYARDPMGGGTGLSDAVKAALPDRLARWPGYVSFLAWADGSPVGLINCFEGFSTFAARPLLNVHDIVVHAARRGRGVGQALLAAAEDAARARGCCKLTLEVLSNNHKALAAYERAGFAPYVLDPVAGQALFLQKWL